MPRAVVLLNFEAVADDALNLLSQARAARLVVVAHDAQINEGRDLAIVHGTRRSRYKGELVTVLEAEDQPADRGGWPAWPRKETT